MEITVLEQMTKWTEMDKNGKLRLLETIKAALCTTKTDEEHYVLDNTKEATDMCMFLCTTFSFAPKPPTPFFLMLCDNDDAELTKPIYTLLLSFSSVCTFRDPPMKSHEIYSFLSFLKDKAEKDKTGKLFDVLYNILVACESKYREHIVENDFVLSAINTILLHMTDVTRIKHALQFIVALFFDRHTIPAYQANTLLCTLFAVISMHSSKDEIFTFCLTIIEALCLRDHNTHCRPGKNAVEKIVGCRLPIFLLSFLSNQDDQTSPNPKHCFLILTIFFRIISCSARYANQLWNNPVWHDFMCTNFTNFLQSEHATVIRYTVCIIISFLEHNIDCTTTAIATSICNVQFKDKDMPFFLLYITTFESFRRKYYDILCNNAVLPRIFAHVNDDAVHYTTLLEGTLTFDNLQIMLDHEQNDDTALPFFTTAFSQEDGLAFLRTVSNHATSEVKTVISNIAETYLKTPLFVYDNEALCIMCMDNDATTICSPCGHGNFCASCLLDWFINNKRRTCPTCSKDVTRTMNRNKKARLQ